MTPFRRALSTTPLLLLALAALSVGVGCGKDGSTTVIIDVSGGDANPFEVGGEGGFVGLSVSSGEGSTIEVRRSGRVDASFPRTSSPPFDLGPVPIVVDDDRTIMNNPDSAPLLDQLYVLGYGGPRISDGDAEMGDEDEEIVTGMRITSRGKLTLGVDARGGAAELVLTHDLVNDGLLTVEDASDDRRASIRVFIEGQYVGSGDIHSFGTSPGMQGGGIRVIAGGNGFNSGDWLAYGADGTDGLAGANNAGGAGGSIGFGDQFAMVGGRIENTGRMVSRGGDDVAPQGNGGQAGGIHLRSALDLWNSGDLDATGGDATEFAGGGGDVMLEVGFLGDLLNSGNVATDGGDSETMNGANASRITLQASGGELRSNARLTSTGGDSRGAGFGGNGGEIYVNSRPSDDNTVRGEDVWISGALTTRGGHVSGETGIAGDGGFVNVNLDNDTFPQGQSIHMLGYERVDATGGAGSTTGGQGGSITARLSMANGVDSGIFIEPPMDSSGGDADPAVQNTQGGDGGEIMLEAPTVEYGEATADGGLGYDQGAPGSIFPDPMAP